MTASSILVLLMIAVVPYLYYRTIYWFKAYIILFNIYKFIRYVLIVYELFTVGIKP